MNDKVPGKVGRSYPAGESPVHQQTQSDNRAPAAQASAKAEIADRTSTFIALFVGIIALIVALVVLTQVWSMSRDFDRALEDIHSARDSAIQSAVGAARAAAKAETATSRANTAEIYSKQIYTEMNRLGYPIKTPAEEHEPQPPEPVRNDDP